VAGESRLVLGRARSEARFPVAPSKATLPRNYAEALAAIKSRIQEERLRVVLSANAAMVLLYWDIGRARLRCRVAGTGNRARASCTNTLVAEAVKRAAAAKLDGSIVANLQARSITPWV